MDSTVIWGVILIAYIVPYFIWSVSREQTLEIRKKLYPGRKEEEPFDKRSTFYGVLWSVGIGLLLVAWWAGMNPLGALLILAILAALIAGGAWLSRQKSLLASRYIRFWVAGTATWLLLVLGWNITFQSETSLEGHQFLFIAILPPLIAAFATAAFKWAKADAKQRK